MKYSSNFDFYLLPSRSIFTDFLSEYKYIDDVPSYNKNDIKQIIDIATKNKIFSSPNNYADAKSLVETIKNNNNSKELEEITNNIINSHMGVPLLKALYDYNFADSNGQKKLDTDIESIISLNNLALYGMPEKQGGLKKLLKKNKN